MYTEPYYLGSHGCIGEGSVCRNIEGHYYCECETGYSLCRMTCYGKRVALFCLSGNAKGCCELPGCCDPLHDFVSIHYYCQVIIVKYEVYFIRYIKIVEAESSLTYFSHNDIW